MERFVEDQLRKRYAREVLSLAASCRNALADFRSERQRCVDYTFGRQWGDRINVDGREITEEEYIVREGNIQLKNNLIRRLVRSVAGVFRGQIDERMKNFSKEDAERAAANDMRELYCRSFEEFLISGMVVHRKWVERHPFQGMKSLHNSTTSNLHNTVRTAAVSPDAFFFDPSARDPRGSDFSVVGQVHELSVGELLGAFANSPAQWRLLSARYGRRGTVKVYEVWRKEKRQAMLCHDVANARVLLVPEEEWRKNAALMAMVSRWTIDDVWRYSYVTEDGELLSDGDSPLPNRAHPFVFKAYPFIDGEIHSFVADIIDQQRYANRLITLYDWVMRATAKGVLLFPEEAIPTQGDIEDVADQWSRFNGVIVYRSRTGQPVPQQVSNTTANNGIGDLLNIQLKMMEDIAGVNGALQGRVDSGNMSGTLFNAQTENSLTALRDIIDTFGSFIDSSLALERVLAIRC